MTTDLDQQLREALRSRAAQVPHSPMPPLPAPARRPRTHWLVPVAAAAAVIVGVAGAVVAIAPSEQDSPPPAASLVPRPNRTAPGPDEFFYSRSVRDANDGVYVEVEVWQSPKRSGPWEERAVSGTLDGSRVIPDPAEPPEERSGRCYPFDATESVACRQRPSWPIYASLDFLAAAPTEPAALRRDLHAAAVAEAQALVNEGVLPAEEALSERGLAISMLGYMQLALSGNGVPEELRTTMRKVVTALPGIQVLPNTADALGRRGTGYRIEPHPDGESTLIFDGDTYLGTPDEAVFHGIAPALGRPPSRLLR
jgi:hypothetical protein